LPGDLLLESNRKTTVNRIVTEFLSVCAT
jgi:hypothetical protein